MCLITLFTSITNGCSVYVSGPSRYTVYPITKNELKSKPWSGTTALLILLLKPRKYKDEDEYLVDAENSEC